MFGNRRFRDLPNALMDKTSENGGSLDSDDALALANWTTEDKATLVTSLCEPEWRPGVGWVETHMPVIDLDIECHLVPSSTPGHSHLYINKPMTKTELWALLEQMARIGLVEEGYVSASKRRGFSAVRHPRVTKTEAQKHQPVSRSYGL